MKAEDLKTKTEDELKKMLLDTRKAQMNARFQRAGGQLEKTHEIRALRRDVARVKTFLAMKNDGGAKTVAKPKARPEAAETKKRAVTKKKTA